MPWAAAAAVAGAVITSKSQKSAAEKQANAVTNASGVSAEAANQARRDALALYDPAFADITTSLQQARNDILSGNRSVNNILNGAFRDSRNALKTSSQQAINAVLGIPTSQPPANDVMPREAKQSVNQATGLRPVDAGAVQRGAIETGKDGTVSPSSTTQDLGYMSGDVQGTLREFQANRNPSEQDTGRMILDDIGNQMASAYEVPQDPERLQELQNLSGQRSQINPDYIGNLSFNRPGEYGLAGAESIIQSGLADQLGVLGGALGAGTNALRMGTQTGREDIANQLGLGVSALRGGVSTGRADIDRGLEAGIGYLDPFRSTGVSAMDREAALSGALGPAAQQEAYANYSESPAQKYLRDQAERASLRNAAATGGVGGGNIKRQLQREAIGMSAQNMQQEIENLRSLRAGGQQAANTSAGLQANAAQGKANLAFGGGQAELAARQNAGMQMAQLAQQLGLSEAQLNQVLGQSMSGVMGDASANISGLRFGAGQDIANQINATGTQLANLQTGLGGNLANNASQTAANISNLAADQGAATSGLRTNLASLLANLATGQGTQQANLALRMGDAQAAGVTNPWGNALTQFSGMYASNPNMFGGGSYAGSAGGQAIGATGGQAAGSSVNRIGIPVGGA